MRTGSNQTREGIRHLNEQSAAARRCAWSAPISCQGVGGQLVIWLARIAIDQEDTFVGEVSLFDFDAERGRELEVPIPLNRIRGAIGIEERTLKLVANIDALGARSGGQTSCLVTQGPRSEKPSLPPRPKCGNIFPSRPACVENVESNPCLAGSTEPLTGNRL